MLEKLSPEQIEKFNKFVEILQRENEKLNLTRILNTDEIKVRHFEDSLIISDRLKDIQTRCQTSPKLVDIGSGAGFPALALAIVLPGWQIVSIEATGKKAEFQQMVAKELALDNTKIVHGRAEILGQNKEYRQKFDVATTRAVGHLAIIAELAVPMLKIGGEFFAWKGPKVETELDKGQKKLTTLGCNQLRQEKYILPNDEQESDYRLIQATKISNTPEQHPREFKIIKQKL